MKKKLIKCDQCGKRFPRYIKQIPDHKNNFCCKGCYSAFMVGRERNNRTTHGMSRHPFYHRWATMLQRCNNPNNVKYKDYGERGIKILWPSFADFKQDMYPSFLVHCEMFGVGDTMIERIDNNGHYCKENCKWATGKEQANNKRDTPWITHNGKRLTLRSWAELSGIKYMTLYTRYVTQHWSFAKSIGTPAGKYYPRKTPNK